MPKSEMPSIINDLIMLYTSLCFSRFVFLYLFCLKSLLIYDSDPANILHMLDLMHKLQVCVIVCKIRAFLNLNWGDSYIFYLKIKIWLSLLTSLWQTIIGALHYFSSSPHWGQPKAEIGTLKVRFIKFTYSFPHWKLSLLKMATQPPCSHFPLH